MESSPIKEHTRSFFPLEEFPDFLELTAHYREINEELLANDYWLNWASDSYDPTGHCNFLEGNWTVCPVYFGHYSPFSINLPSLAHVDMMELTESLHSKFPKTTQLLGKIHSINFAAFSRLHPKSSLAPHSHKNPLSLIYHLGLIIPSGSSCGICVDNQTKHWKKQGDAVIFDDNLVHSAWNKSDQERIILYVDFKRSPA